MGAEGESAIVRISQAKGQRIFTIKGLLVVSMNCPKNDLRIFLWQKWRMFNQTLI